MIHKTIAFIFLIAVTACSGEDKALEEKLRAQFVKKILTLRGFYSYSVLKYGSDGKLSSKSATGPWTLDGKVEITDLKISDKLLKIHGDRMWVRWDKPKDQKQVMHFVRSPESVEIEAELGPSGSVEVPTLLKSIFVSADEQMSDLVPDIWKPYFGEPFAKTLVSGLTAATTYRIRVSENVSEGQLMKKVQPEYPHSAKVLGLQGTLIFNALIGTDGTLKWLRVKQPLGLGMEESAAEAISKWQYKPYLLSSQPVEVETVITVKYELR